MKRRWNLLKPKKKLKPKRLKNPIKVSTQPAEIITYCRLKKCPVGNRTWTTWTNDFIVEPGTIGEIVDRPASKAGEYSVLWIGYPLVYDESDIQNSEEFKGWEVSLKNIELIDLTDELQKEIEIAKLMFKMGYGKM